MALPLQILTFDAFLGTQEGVHSVLLPDIFSSGGSYNVYIDKFARIRALSGKTILNQTTITTNGGGDATMIRGLIPYQATSGGSITRKLLAVADDQTNEWEIWVSSDGGGTFSFLYDAGSGSVGMIPDASQFGDKIYITNGKVQPRVYNGTTMAATGLTQSPTPTAAASATNGYLTGNYTYKLVSTIAGVRQKGSATSTSILMAGGRVNLSWTADSNASVDGYEIYRTTGTGTLFHFLTAISGRLTVSYTDFVNDAKLQEGRILEEHGDAPPVAYWCESHKQRMWWLRTDTNPTRAYWSDPGEPESVYAFNYLDFSDSENVGDVITGAVGNYENLLVVFTEQAVWTVGGTGTKFGDITDWTQTRTAAATGSVGSRSCVRIPAGSKFQDATGQTQTTETSTLAYFTPLGDIRIFDGEGDTVVSHALKDTVRDYAYAHRAKIHALLDIENDQAIWFLPSSTASEPDIAVAWSYRYGVWYKWTTNTTMGASTRITTSTDGHLLVVGNALTSEGGRVHSFLDGSTGPNAFWVSKTIYGMNEDGTPDYSRMKRWRWLDALFAVSGTATGDLGVTAAEALDTATYAYSSPFEPAAVTVQSADASALQTSDGSTIAVAQASLRVKILLPGFYDEGVRFRCGGTDWTLEALFAAYQALPGHGRRVQ